MSNFEAISFNLYVGCGVVAGSLLAFSAAVRFGFQNQLAPRVCHRPNDVIKNVLKRPYWFHFIPWTLNLSYKEMLIGIEGTGTRDNGWQGSKLKVNLDGVILIKFHALCLKVVIFATFICCVVLLPLNVAASANCKGGEEECSRISKLTSFEKTTLAAIPGLEEERRDGEGFNIRDLSLHEPGITSKLFGVVVVAWCIYIYTCVLVWYEWIDNLEFRRSFYLEFDHFGARKDERDSLAKLNVSEDSLQKDRPPYLPHPEARETVPSVCLYSVLYKLPQVIYLNDLETAERSPVDRQLNAAIEFFEKCVPKQPGYTSSVAAVTILPDSSHVTEAWKKWHACTKLLRRLSFIRRQLQLKYGEEDKETVPTDPFDFYGVPYEPMQGDRKRSSNYDEYGESPHVGLEEVGELKAFLSDDRLEQIAVYCREYAQSSAGCCPYGCDYWRIRSHDEGELKNLINEVESHLKNASEELSKARKQAAYSHEADEDEENQSEHRDLEFVNEIDSGESTVSLESRAIERSWSRASLRLQERRESIRLRHRPLADGKWMPGKIIKTGREIVNRNVGVVKQAKDYVRYVIAKSSYVVVTFTSRQAAIAARQCQADGSGGRNSWTAVQDIPVPPLADTPTWNDLSCRGICRPVTLTISDESKRCRKTTTIVFLVIFCLTYTIPLAAASRLVRVEELEKIFPSIVHLSEISGFLTGLLYILFFTICPFIFKALANYGSGATSLRQAEFEAIRYYWYFMLVTSFATTTLVTLITEGLRSGVGVGQQFQQVLREVADSIPIILSTTWFNWIVVKALITYPVSYLLQINTFLFSIFGLACCRRLVTGGGPGGPIPMRIYVDSAVVFLCVVSFAPACPLVAPAGMIYFLIFSPMLRWLLIFVYRPQYDGGGLRWPLIHDILISAMVTAQVLLTTMMILKSAYGPAFLAALAVIPTIFFNQITKSYFLLSYQDAGLIQTSLLDGKGKFTSVARRNEFLKWLVDCHKASFVPICLAGSDNFITSVPARVEPIEEDQDDDQEAPLPSKIEIRGHLRTVTENREKVP